ncbi:Arc-like DNA binding domain-containing protein [Thermomonospora echinospora]|uniref:Arc-like DNA binding domain-containing protein n=1 Tax=Thermomonospora echinospora TaxID=1992 RepID=A0A1H5W0R6_9ACTN|nr:Arc family DNA-binding protein [Thermomonospora echinospora]SEF93070.1 Arc-like DNA binding domain-containing protein [Thermomonospora echinospora]
MIRLSLRLPDDLHTRLVARAHADRRSLNSEILHLLETALNTTDDESPGGDTSSPAPPRGKPDSSPA